MHRHQLNRRQFFAGVSQFAALALAGLLPGDSLATAPQFSADPFSLGVASGDPLADGVVLWTRLAPDPLRGGGLPPRSVPVRWQVAVDEGMRRVVRRGTATALPGLGHSVHVDVRGLEPARHYWYQFNVGDAVSPMGRTRTAPAPGAKVDRLRFAFASCQHYEHGYFTPYTHMAAEDLDLVVHLGDYIYEGTSRANQVLRRHPGPEPTTLADYRNRHALYKSESPLRQAHAAHPWVVTWDDHEVENNYAGATSEERQAPEVFLLRRAAAYQAYYEHMPLRLTSMPRGARMRIYRRLTFGRLAEFSVLDTRQYRSDQPCDDGRRIPPCPAAIDERALMTGPAQERWLLDGLNRSRARWNVIAQQVMMAALDRLPGAETGYDMDKWTGYVAPRNRLLGYLLKRRPANPIILTGDIHLNIVADLKADFADPKSQTAGTEFVVTSITSNGDGADQTPETEQLVRENGHVPFANSQRGYVRATLTPERWQSDYRVVEAVTRPFAPIRTRASFVVENDRPGVRRA